MDLTPKIAKVIDTSVYDAIGTRTPVRRYTVYIGTFGPFVIDVPITDPFNDQAVQQQITKLKTHLGVITG
jgi:hypothetical protein